MSQVLLIEPDHLLAGHIKAFLAHSGHKVEIHADPQAAVMAADGRCPDAVVIDLMLASHSAIEFLYEFRSYPEWQTVPVIILSSLPLQDIQPFKEVFAQLSISDCLYKPEMRLPQLGRSIEACLQPV